MSTRFFWMLAAALACATAAAAQQPPARVPAGNSSDWIVEGPTRAGDVKVEPFLGRPAVWLRAGTHAIKTGSRFADGTIEFDVAPMSAGDFVAVVFRRESLQNHENLYIRPAQSGDFMALQYAPRTNGSSTWQLYREFNVATTWPRNQWTHVKVEVTGSKLDVFVGDGVKPTLSVARLRHTADSGEVAFWARVNNKPEDWAAAIANVQVRPAASAAPRTAAPPVAKGMVAQWEVSTPAAAGESMVEAVPAGLQWAPVTAEETGLVNLNRVYRAQPQQGRQTVFARTFVDANETGRQLAGIGYSDDVTVFVNGERVYSGINGWESRSPGYASFVDARFEQVWLPLKPGRNEVVLAVTDDQRFGWGFAMSLAPQ